MISVDEAYNKIIHHNLTLPDAMLSYTRPFRGVVLEPMLADRDLPPFHRVTMDGVALNSQALATGQRRFKVQACQRAGAEPMTLLKSSECIEVMTGSGLPMNTDLVIRYEDIEIMDGVCHILEDVAAAPMQNVHMMGSDSRKGESILPKGLPLTPPRWAMAASIGQHQLSVKKYPRIDVLATGDELVDVETTPLPQQIRHSNLTAIHAALVQHGFDDVYLHKSFDNRQKLFEHLKQLLASSDCVIITGGVSAGLFDFVPSVLSDLDVRTVFHKVRQKPGKPLWFGVSPANKPVFGLPGNPVSTLVCFYRYVLPYLRKCVGDLAPAFKFARLTDDIVCDKPLTLFVPVSSTQSSDAITFATPIKNQGSGDFASLGMSDGFIELPENETLHRAGLCFPMYLWS